MLKTLPNLLTLSRIAVIPLVVGTFYLQSPWDAWIGWGLFAAASVTHWLRGHFSPPWSADFGLRPLPRRDRRQAARVDDPDDAGRLAADEPCRAVPDADHPGARDPGL